MIEKMKYVNITGRLEDLDRVIREYIAKYEMQLEYSMKELKDTENLEPINLPNPYAFPLRIAERFVKMTKLPLNIRADITEEQAFKYIEIAENFYTEIASRTNALDRERRRIEKLLEILEPFRSLEFDIEHIKDFNYIKYKFGKMPISSYKQFESYMYDEKEVLFVKGKSDAEFVWCVYFTTAVDEDVINSLFTTLHFKEIKMQFTHNKIELKGAPADIYNDYNEKYVKINNEIKELEEKHIEGAELRNEDIVIAYNKFRDLYRSFDLRKYAAHTESGYCIFVGWMSEKNALALNEKIENDDNVILILQDINDNIPSKPPTKLNNPKIFKGFEMFVKMYGLPSYGEFDPTVFVGITYTIIFGLMFGDVGQGFLLSLLGLFLYKSKGFDLGKIMAIIGVSSMFFGFMYGSIFGFEDIMKPLWMSPPHNMNFILIMTVGMGVGLIIFAICLNIINLIRAKDYKTLLFHPNGISGLVFYVSLIVIALTMFLGHVTVSAVLIAIFLVIPIILIAFREPIIRLLEKEEHIIHTSFPMFVMETVIEMFEILLSYLTNTISFVRVGAFALSHAGMMSVVLLLAETANGGHNVIIVILGNLLVMALEGLVVGIQVLRLEFYEMFSRFFRGEGRSFEPFKLK